MPGTCARGHRRRPDRRGAPHTAGSSPICRGGRELRRLRRAPSRRAVRVGRSGVVATGRGRFISVLPARGEVWWCEMAEIGRRPVVILSRDAVMPRLRRALVAPCTTTVRGLASEVLLERGEDPVPRRTAVNLDSVESVSVAVLVNRLAGWPTPGCVRSARPSRSRSTARPDNGSSRGLGFAEVSSRRGWPSSPYRRGVAAHAPRSFGCTCAR